MISRGSPAAGSVALADQRPAGAAQAQAEGTAPLHRFVIEREIPGAGKLTPAELRDAAARSNRVLHELGPGIQWVQSYVTGDKLYCIYNAPSEALIRRHAERAGFPANRIHAVSSVIDPTTAAGR